MQILIQVRRIRPDLTLVCSRLLIALSLFELHDHELRSRFTKEGSLAALQANPGTVLRSNYVIGC